MPGSLAPASVAPGAVFPQTLSTAFTQTLAFPLIATSYHDGTSERSLVTDGTNPARAMRVWKLTKRLTPAEIATLTTFWETVAFGPLNPFYLYDSYASLPIGSSYDPTGVSTTGRVTCFFRGSWSYVVTIARVNLGELTLVEVT